MDNPFKKILQDEKLPDYLKERVIDNINFIKLSLDVTELYMVKVPQAITNALSDIDKKKQEALIEKIKNSNKKI